MNFDLSGVVWRKSSRSQPNGSCVEVAYLDADIVWRKSSRSQPNGNCVEVADLDPHMAVRDSKDVDGPVLVFEAADWRAFIARARQGGYDLT